MKHIFTLFLVFLLPTLPAFGLSLSDKSPVFKFCNGGGQIKCNKITSKDGSITYRGILACTAGKKSGISEQELDEALENYCNNISEPSDIDKTSEPVVKNKVLSINGGAVVSDGKDNITLRVTVKSPNTCKIKGSSLHTANSDLVHTIECPSTATSLTLQYSIDDQKQAFAYNIENPTQTINLNKARSGYNLPEKIQITKKQATSKPKTTTAAPADEDFDFVAAQKSDRAAYETDYEAEPYGTTTTTTKPKSSLRAGDDNELQMVGEIHAADAESDAESDAKYSEQQNTSKKSKQTSITNICKSSAHRLNCANMTITCTDGFVNGMTQEKALQLLCPGDVAAEQQRRKQIKESANNRFCKSGMTFSDQCSSNQVTFGCAEYSRHAPNEIKKALKNYCNSKKENNVIVKDNGAEKSVQKKAQSDINFELSGKFEIDNASLPSNITATLSPSACKSVASKYFSGKNFSKNYKCPAGTTSVTFTFLTEDKKAQTKYDIQNATQTVNLTGAKKYTLGQPIKFVPKTISVGKNDPSKQEMSQNDIARDNCVRHQDKKHTKFENNKCVCESNDYEMQSDGYCTLKRAKCLKQKNTKYENGRCVCTSDDYTMQPDNNCILTSPDAIAAEASEMEDAENAAELEKLDLETRKELCATYDRGEWDSDNNKCKCKKGYKLSKTGECAPNKRTLSNNEKKALCQKNGAGKWTEKNKCECTDKTHSFDDELGCTENKIKAKHANKEAENNRKKELCKSPNTWNDTLNKCTCNDKKQFFDDELGCTAASQAFTNAETELNTLKGQLDTKLTELASANESEEQ
ncbi:MAG: hypothetical protein R8M71_00560 [Alphaproteobacteria bacterium]|nr:hypothetical protein [Alphaproteobacteria bacterium]